ncbi:hypothetical protein [Shimia sp.]|uniref:hypothetical protein n=1 Tax=unclassified Shimia TaxID=2630038 RepID=UPI0025E8F803|nr:hypothetical protein [Shimia sp.]MCH2069599.1 hypothetical protein [Shimia sp.]
MTLENMPKAVDEYLAREEAAMKSPQGANHAALFVEVGKAYGIDPDELSNAVLERTILGAN